MTVQNKLFHTLSLFCLLSTILTGQTVFTYRSPESDSDKRFEYDNAVLRLALDKTVDSHGEYVLKASPAMNFARAHHGLKEGLYDNPMFKSSAKNEFCEESGYVNFPIDLGIVGYRVFFVSEKVTQSLKDVRTLEDLRRFTLIQGIGWADIEILRNSNLQVVVQSGYESLFRMVASGRVVLYYPLPRFFFTNKGNQSAIDRVYMGLIEAYEDGSLLELWKSHYQESLDYADLNSRRIIQIENPLINEVDNSYEEYVIQFQTQE